NRLLADKVPDRREAELGYEPFLGDDVAFVKLAHLDFEFAFAERPPDQVRVCRGDEGLFPLAVHLHPDGHRSVAATTVRRAYTCFSRGCKSRLLAPSASTTRPLSRAGCHAPARSARCPRSPRRRRVPQAR